MIFSRTSCLVSCFRFSGIPPDMHDAKVTAASQLMIPFNDGDPAYAGRSIIDMHIKLSHELKSVDRPANGNIFDMTILLDNNSLWKVCILSSTENPPYLRYVGALQAVQPTMDQDRTPLIDCFVVPDGFEAAEGLGEGAVSRLRGSIDPFILARMRWNENSGRVLTMDMQRVYKAVANTKMLVSPLSSTETWGIMRTAQFDVVQEHLKSMRMADDPTVLSKTL
jgi:hypothetical protein